MIVEDCIVQQIRAQFACTWNKDVGDFLYASDTKQNTGYFVLCIGLADYLPVPATTSHHFHRNR